MKRSSSKNILVMMPTVSYPERLKIDGILTHANNLVGEDWNIEIEPERIPEETIRDRLSGFDAAIIYITGEKERNTVISTGIPTVLVEDLTEPKRFSKAKHIVSILCDHVHEGETAAKHFLERHYTSFAFIGSPDADEWSKLRLRGFKRAVSTAGHQVSVYPVPPPHTQFIEEEKALTDFLKALPAPSAVYADCDYRARQVLLAAKRAGLRIPYDLAILGTDNDNVFCKTTSPNLSSIETDDFEFGRITAEALDSLIAGKKGNGKVIRVFHDHVATRGSTDSEAIDDTLIAKTLQYIREHLSEKLTAATLAKHVNYSKRMLQLRFERTLGVPLGSAIRNLRISAAKDLLVNTRKSVAEIAEECGFTDVSHLSRHIRRVYNKTPLALRKRR